MTMIPAGFIPGRFFPSFLFRVCCKASSFPVILPRMGEEDVQFTTNDGKTFHSPSLKFDGPLELLLYLIQQSEVNIYDIPISQITDQFITYLGDHQDMDLDLLADFYRMAAELLYIKSRMLLPVDVQFDEEFEDPRKELVDQLIEYQKFKKYTQLLSGGGTSEFAIMRKETEFMLPFADKDLFEGVTVQNLLETFTKLVKSIAPDKVFNVYESVSLNEKIALMDELLEKEDTISLEDVIVHMDSKIDIICAFMAILECCKLNKIVIYQAEPYGDIVIKAKAQDFSGEDADAIDDQYDEMIEHGLGEKDNFSTIREGEAESTGSLHDETNDRDVTYDEDGDDEVISLDDDDDGDKE